MQTAHWQRSILFSIFTCTTSRWWWWHLRFKRRLNAPALDRAKREKAGYKWSRSFCCCMTKHYSLSLYDIWYDIWSIWYMISWYDMILYAVVGFPLDVPVNFMYRAPAAERSTRPKSARFLGCIGPDDLSPFISVFPPWCSKGGFPNAILFPFLQLFCNWPFPKMYMKSSWGLPVASEKNLVFLWFISLSKCKFVHRYAYSFQLFFCKTVTASMMRRSKKIKRPLCCSCFNIILVSNKRKICSSVFIPVLHFQT